MAYEVVMSYHLHMPSYFLGTFTEYPQINTPIEMIIFQWEYLFTPTPPIPSNML